MRLEARILGLGRQDVRLANQNHGSVRVAVKKSQAGRNGHGGADIPAHGIDSDPDHGATGAVKI
jgi:hypothetical protein